jgi:hypothetical protein
MTVLNSDSRSPLLYLVLAVIIVAVIAAQVGAVYRLQSLFGAPPTQELVSVDTLLNYGNGTSIWHNLTDVPSDWNFYQLTTRIAQTEASSTTSVSGLHYVLGLDGVRSSGAYYWTLWTFCHKDTAWAASPVGADLLRLRDGDVLAWYYQASSSINPADWDPPVAGALKVGACSR